MSRPDRNKIWLVKYQHADAAKNRDLATAATFQNDTLHQGDLMLT